MVDLSKLRSLVRDNGYLYTKDVTNAGIRRENLKNFLDEGIIVRESRGIYSFTDEWNDEFVLLQEKCKKGVFSYGTALYFHGLSDRFPEKISMTVPKNYNVFYLKEKLTNVEFHRIKPALWNLGIIEMTSPQGGNILVYDIERCICDIIRNKKDADPQIFIQSIKGYFSLKNHNYSKIVEYAKQFHIEKEIYIYIEVLT
ncbi:type IV toxin-antitoxin system AbiEi family antitoxin domain-containing protein [uncultured Traorella sp.]|uniref:type IV toxin-antitoxin system AbiEi family antitoxin domain-containing protein n=1 Tax=uncultured Traorella sp. TaxID=1929048 RepID=UPI0025F22460|nr:type IV toxin-antitoxin system AbiEi family antitoxin domain-containing protein [uncultured Traorella sp.]